MSLEIGGQGERSTLRLVMPQWQGGGLQPAYPLGSRLLAWLAPGSSAVTVEVPIDSSGNDLGIDRGIYARDIVLAQARAARRILEQRRPDRVVVFGGECSVDFAPFAYLSERYGSDLAVLWFDAHPDLSTPGGDYPYFHAMVLSALLGIGDPEFVAEVPRPLDPRRVMFVGLRSGREEELVVGERLGLSMREASVARISQDSAPVLDWLRESGAGRVAIHFDLDVLDPGEFSATVGVEPNGLSVESAVRLLADVAAAYDVVGLGVTEYMPRETLVLSNLLRQLPLVSER